MPSDQAAGTTQTVAVFIADQIRAGVHLDHAAGAAGVLPAEVRSWMREGAVAISRLNSGQDWGTMFSPHQQDCAMFAETVNRAISAHASMLAVVLENEARGGRAKTTTRRKTVNGQLAEEVVTTEYAAPDVTVAMWKLERMHAGIYGARSTVDVNIADLTDTEDVASAVLAKMQSVAARLGPTKHPDAIEASSIEAPAGD